MFQSPTPTPFEALLCGHLRGLVEPPAASFQAARRPDAEPDAPTAAPRPSLLARCLVYLRARLSPPAMEPDLIDHPDFRGMSLLELADLPFPRPSVEAAEPRATSGRDADAA